MRIGSNILALGIQPKIAETSKAIARSIKRMSSGQRINSSAGGAAELAMGSRLEAQRRGTIQVLRNINDSRGFLNAADGALQVQTDIVQRMRELAVQGANGTLSDNDREYLNIELQQLYEEFNRLTSQVNFNGVKLLDGSFGIKSLYLGSSENSIDLELPALQANGVFTYRYTGGTGTFQTRSVVASTGANPYGLTSDDFNGDGNLDLAWTENNGGSPILSVALGRGDGTFATRQTFTTGSGSQYLQSGDFDGDGDSDIAVAENDGTSGLIAVFLNNGSGIFGTRQTARTSSAVGNAFYVTDLNGDGKSDIVHNDASSQTASILLGLGNGTFQSRTTIFAGGGGFFNGLNVGDINGDNKIDIVTADEFAGRHDIYLGNGDGTFQTRTTIAATSTSMRAVSLGDINGDSKLDLLVTDQSNLTMATYLGNGNGTFQSARTSALGTGTPAHMTLRDLNGDGNLDVIEISQGVGVNVLLGNGDGTFRTRLLQTGGTWPSAFALGDFNGDEILDLGTVDSTGNNIGVSIENSQWVTSNPTVTVATQSAAEKMISVFDNALEYISEARSSIGALSSRLDYAESAYSSLVENLSSASSLLLDTDYAEETAELVRNQILQQAQVAILGQANINMQLVLELFRGH